MAMQTKLYKIVVFEIDAEIDAEGVTVTEVPAASYSTEAVSPWDAAMQWAALLKEQESS